MSDAGSQVTPSLLGGSSELPEDGQDAVFGMIDPDWANSQVLNDAQIAAAQNSPLAASVGLDLTTPIPQLPGSANGSAAPIPMLGAGQDTNAVWSPGQAITFDASNPSVSALTSPHQGPFLNMRVQSGSPGGGNTPAVGATAPAAQDADTLNPRDSVIMTGQNAPPQPAPRSATMPSNDSVAPAVTANDIDPSQTQVRQPPDADAAIKIIADKISSAESNGNPNAVGNAAADTSNKRQPYQDFSQGTVADAVAWQRDRAVNGTHPPIGLFQVMPGTLERTAKKIGVLDQPFTPEIQQQIGVELLKQRGIQGYLDSGNSAPFTENVTKEWDTVPANGAGLSRSGRIARIKPQEWNDALTTARQVYQPAAAPPPNTGVLSIPYPQNLL